MARKGFLVKVELEIQRVSCPGVWLCSNGSVSLQLHLLGSSVQTNSKKPSFPIQCREHFVFYKAFHNERRLNELQRSLNCEWLRAELVQWRSCDEGRVLATFSATLNDVLYPSATRGAIAGADVDLLMEPTALFPGTIAPKLEINTKTTVEECFSEIDGDNMYVVNPKMLVSNIECCSRKNKSRKVCHTVAYSRARKNQNKKPRPVFKYQRPEEDLILRTNPDKVVRDENLPSRVFRRTEFVKHCKPCSCFCKAHSKKPHQNENYTTVIRENIDETVINPHDSICACGKIHKQYSCPICLRYEGYFSQNPNTQNRQTNSNDKCQKCNSKEHFKSENDSPCASDDNAKSSSKIKDCMCASAASAVECASRARHLARELHERVARAISNNSRLLGDAGCVETRCD